MTAQQFQEMVEYGQKRDEKVYAWLRYLIGLASGALAVLVSLQSHSEHGVAGIAQKVAWISLGSGILLGSLRLYGEVWTEREMVKKLVAERKRQALSGDATTLPIVAMLPRYVRLSERLCYCSLILAVVSLVVFALIRS
jgi:hypothetical protein